MTDVKPLISVATYVDDDTGFEVYQPVTGRLFSNICDTSAIMQAYECARESSSESTSERVLRFLILCRSVPGRTFLPITKAPAAIVAQGGNKKPLMLQTHGSKFVQFQEVKIQEMASEVLLGP